MEDAAHLLGSFSDAPASASTRRMVWVAASVALLCVVSGAGVWSHRGGQEVSLVAVPFHHRTAVEQYKHVAMRNPTLVWPQMTREADPKSARRLDSQYQKAIRTMVSNLRRRQHTASTEASQIEKALPNPYMSNAGWVLEREGEVGAEGEAGLSQFLNRDLTCKARNGRR